MFPNDDICSMEAAKHAAQRLFRRYKNTQNKEVPILGKTEVNRLMKEAYTAINLPYEPNEEDVYSFINIFDSNQDGKIELKDLEQMALKYLCGVDEEGKQIKQVIENGQTQQEPMPNQEMPVPQQKVKSINISNISSKPSFSIIIEPNSELASHSELIKRVMTPITPVENKQSTISTESSTIFNCSSERSQDCALDEILVKGEAIFRRYMSIKSNGIQKQMAGSVLNETYKLLKKQNYSASSEDIAIWLNLCDKDKDGVVKLDSYKYFVERVYERQHLL